MALGKVLHFFAFSHFTSQMGQSEGMEIKGNVWLFAANNSQNLLGDFITSSYRTILRKVSPLFFLKELNVKEPDFSLLQSQFSSV